MRLLHQLVGRALLKAGQIADQVCVDAEPALGVLPEADLGGDAGGVVEVNLLVPRDQAQRPEEAGGEPAEKSSSGLTPSPLPPISFGGRVSISILPSVDLTWPSRPPPVEVDSAV